MSLINDKILEKLNSLIVVINDRGEAEYVSPSAKRILGYEPEELLGGSWWSLTRGNAEERDHVRELALKQLQQTSLAETVPYERQLMTSSGKTRWILWNTSRGPLNTLIGIGHDITERKQAEQRLLESNRLLQQQNKDMMDSINYASHIQNAILPDLTQFRNYFSDLFVLYQPKDVVSGDYYFFHRDGDRLFVAAVDCTGHGVPGALMSVVANSILREVITKKGLTDPAEILHAMDDELFSYLQSSDRDVTSDGMDVALTVFDLKSMTMWYAGAFRPLLLLRDEEFMEISGSRFPIGFYGDVQKSFESHEVKIRQGDSFYLFTDGYCDQFGGESSKKFNRRRFRELLLSATEMEMSEQETFLSYALKNWRQEQQQVDDVLVIGIRI